MAKSNQRLIVSHSHSCAPVELFEPCIPFGWLPLNDIILDPAMGRWPIVKLLLDINVVEIEGMLGVAPRERAISTEPTKLLGASISMADDANKPSPLLCRRCRFEEAVEGRELDDEAPGPGVAFGGAAAIGTTPLPPAATAVVPAFPY